MSSQSTTVETYHEEDAHIRSGRPSSKHSASTARGAESQIIEPDSLSTTDDEADGSSTQSLTDSVWTFPKEHGRTYHGYRAGTYHFPNDPNETDRLEFQHCFFHELLQSQLHFAPLKNPCSILDIGTGTGEWAIEMGDLYPDANVEGTDLSPIQPTAVPENVQFIIDNAEDADWAVPPDHYDYIHMRELLGCFRDMSEIIKQGYKHLSPGGYMESHEVHTTLYCDDDTLPADWTFSEWLQYLDDAAMSVDRPIRIGNKLERWYKEAGFVDVQQKIYKVPMNPWPKDPQLKRIGLLWQENFLMGLQGFSLAYFSREFGWSKEEIEVYLVGVRKALMDRRVHAYQKLFIVWGRKPEAQADPTSVPLPSSPVETKAAPNFQSQFPTSRGDELPMQALSLAPEPLAKPSCPEPPAIEPPAIPSPAFSFSCPHPSGFSATHQPQSQPIH